ncbi:MAG: hypothetical protein KF716_30210 [Anaerolineae bacterium]|nr:hypothetical protein [Anaerolineae bacterium]
MAFQQLEQSAQHRAPHAAHSLRLAGAWAVMPIPLAAAGLPENLAWEHSLSVPDCCHLQPALYPQHPYWGEHLRAINQQAWIYRRQFTVPDVAFQRARLRFEGVDYYATVWLNGTLIGEHEGNFAPFTFDVTAALRRDAENTLIVRVTAPWDTPNLNGIYPSDHVIRGMVKGLYEHGDGVIPPAVNPLGIWQPVWLLLDDGLSLDQVRVRGSMAGKVTCQLTAANTTDQAWCGTLVVSISAENHAGQGASITKPITLSVGTQTIDLALHIPDPRLWWPWDHGLPNLYRLTAELVNADTCTSITTTFGLREIKLERSPDQFTYLINERPVFVRGTSYIPGLYLSQCNRESLTHDLALVRDLNLNLLRLHVHVSPSLLYDLCDRAGIMIWQDFELCWIHDPSPEFEARALRLQHEMIDLLGNHASIITWSCHNEPTMVFSQRANLEQHPDPALYADAQRQDPTRPVFLCSGQMDTDWQRAGDTHSYYGALWTERYTDVYHHKVKFSTEFGFEAPATLHTLQTYPECWDRLQHLDGHMDELWAYQAQLIQYHVEHFRRLRAQSCAGYIHFLFADLVPQVGCGILDAQREPKGGYYALQRASRPLHIALEYDDRRCRAVWVFNDTAGSIRDCVATCRILDRDDQLIFLKQLPVDIAANQSQRIAALDWSGSAAACWRVELELRDQGGQVVACNQYDCPLQPLPRPRGYPWKFDPFLGCKVFDRPDAPSLADLGGSSVIKVLPLPLRERLGEWVLRQHLPTAVLSLTARVAALLNPVVNGNPARDG